MQFILDMRGDEDEGGVYSLHFAVCLDSVGRQIFGARLPVAFSKGHVVKKPPRTDLIQLIHFGNT